MPRGYPDWGVLAQQIGAADVDLAELAVRLGATYRFTRTGRLVFEDDFEGDLSQYAVSLGTGTNTVDVSGRYGFQKAGALLWNSAVNPANDSVGISLRLPFLAATRYGIETLIRSYTDDMIYTQSLAVFDNLAKREFGLRLNFTANTINALGEDGSYSLIASKSLVGGVFGGWTLIKTVFDYPTDRYGYVRINDTLYNAISQSPDDSVTAVEQYIVEVTHTFASSATGDNIAMAYHVITMDEP